jgi:hypothetical protein
MDDLGAVEFGKVLGVTVSGNSRATTLQLAATGQEGDDDGAERIDAVEVLQPAGLMAAPSLSSTAEAAFVRIGDQVIALAVIDKGAPSQAVEAGEVRLYGPGSSNASAVIRIRADGSIEIVSAGATLVKLQDGSQPFVRGTVYADALGTFLDALKIVMTGIGTFATAVGAALPPVAAAAATLGGLITTFNSACDALKAARTAYLSVKVSGQ